MHKIKYNINTGGGLCPFGKECHVTSSACQDDCNYFEGDDSKRENIFCSNPSEQPFNKKVVTMYAPYFFNDDNTHIHYKEIFETKEGAIEESKRNLSKGLKYGYTPIEVHIEGVNE